MAKIFTSDEFIKRAKQAANEFKTIYAKGCFGWPMIPVNKKRAISSYSYNAAPARQKVINAASADTFAFDCVCYIKALLWGWVGDPGKIYGGAEFKSNGVPDFDTEQMLDYCTHVSEDFTKIIPGCVLHNPGHVGIYLGDGLAAECTARWKDGVQITNVDNLGMSSVNNGRTWQEYGRLQWIDYITEEVPKEYVASLTWVKKGSHGASVALAQTLLNDTTVIDVQLEVDGVCGTKTVQAINDFQTAMRDLYGIECGTNGKNDGIIGRKCWELLLGVPVKGV